MVSVSWLIFALFGLGLSPVSDSARLPLQTMSSSPLHRGPQYHDSLRCDLCADNWLFILAAGGRTGSTTSLSMFKSIPSFELSGEHWAVLTAKEAEFEMLKKQQAVRYQAQNYGHKVDWLAMKCNVQQLTKDIIFGNAYEKLAKKTKVLGFKEIRYTTPRMVHFLSEVFPCARMVFPMRLNAEAAVHAEVFRTSTPAHKIWRDASLLANGIHDTLPDIASLMPLETLSVGHFNHVLRKLGVKGCAFTRVVHDNADGGYKADTQGSPISGECDFSRLNFRLSEREIDRNREKWAQLFQRMNFEGFTEPGITRFQDLYEYT